MNPGNQWIDDIRRRIQAALNDSKRDIFEVLESQIDGDRGHVLGRITWSAGVSRHEIEVTFQVYRSRYLDEAWSIEQTSLIDELMKIYG